MAHANNPRSQGVNALRRAVLARLIAHPLVSTGHICVAATEGRVTLSGYVTSNVQKDAAIAATRRVEGVEHVVDDLRVAVPWPAAHDSPAQVLEARPPIEASRTFGAVRARPQADIGAVMASSSGGAMEHAADDAHPQ